MKSLIKLITPLSILASLISGCTTTKKNYEITPIDYLSSSNTRIFIFDPKDKQDFTLSTGSTITIPASCFVNQNGNTISSKVHLTFKEIHSLAEIIASGIPMRYDSAGVTHHFQTAGMFEIQGISDSKEIFIAKNKKIQIAIASNKKGNDYNFYHFNKRKQTRQVSEASLIQINTTVTSTTILNKSIKGNWVYTKTEGTATNQEKIKREKELKKEKLELQNQRPIHSTERGSDALVFDLTVNNINNLNQFRNLMWQFVHPETEHLNLFSQKWKRIELTETSAFGKYNLKLEKKEQTITTLVSPVLYGKELEEFSQILKKNQGHFKIQEQQLETKEQQINKMGNVLRNAQVKAFGVYNWDKLLHIIEKETIYKKPLMAINNKTISDFYMVYGGQNETVIHYTAMNINEFFFFKPLPSSIIIIHDTEMYTVNKQNLKAYYMSTKKRKRIIPNHIGSRPSTTVGLNKKLFYLLEN
jgi:hypothetical protein